MTLPIIVLDAAEEELSGAEAWYDTQRPGLGKEFLRAIDEAVAQLQEAPHYAHPIQAVPASLGVRQAFVKRFPFAIVFMEHDTALWIIAFAHQHRKPGYWRTRLS